MDPDLQANRYDEEGSQRMANITFLNATDPSFYLYPSSGFGGQEEYSLTGSGTTHIPLDFSSFAAQTDRDYGRSPQAPGHNPMVSTGGDLATIHTGFPSPHYQHSHTHSSHSAGGSASLPEALSRDQSMHSTLPLTPSSVIPPLANPHPGGPPSLRVARSMKSTSRFSQGLSSRSATPRSQTSATSSVADFDGSEVVGFAYMSAFSDGGPASRVWKKMMADAPTSPPWRNRILALDIRLHAYVKLSVTRAVMNAHLPDRRQILNEVDAVLSCEAFVRCVNDLSCQKLSSRDEDGALSHWIKGKPGRNLPATNFQKVVWVAENPFVICLKETAVESYADQVGAAIHHSRFLSNQMVFRLLNAPHARSGEQSNSTDFQYIHLYGQGPARDITSVFGEANAKNRIDYYGNVDFQSLVGKFITPYMPYLAYAIRDQHYYVTLKYMALPGAMVCFSALACLVLL